MKHVIGLYGATVLIAVICFNFWGQYAFRGFAYNLGLAVVWPAVVFPSFGALLGGLFCLVVIVALLTLKSGRN